jgi:uncharacterized membrane protein
MRPFSWSRGALWERRSALGLLLGALAFVISFAPSLLPRPWPVQATAAALSALSGYAVGALASYFVRPVVDWFGVRVVAAESRRTLLRGLVVGAVLVAVVWAAMSFHEGRVLTARLVGAEPPTWNEDGLAVVAGLAGALLFLLVVGVLRLVTHVPHALLRFALPRWASRLVSLAVVLLLVAWASNQFLVQRTMRAVSTAAAALDQSSPGLDPPSSPLRSGGPGATQEWEDLGRQGQRFTAAGPGAERIAEVTGRSATEPIRVYASLPAGDTPAEIAETVVTELERTGAFDREVLTLINTTGRGWVDEFNVSAIEYLMAGDTATAAMQYSYLPSPVALLSDRRTPREAGQALFRAVHEAWSQRPEDDRPALYVGGESLGAFGGTSAFDDLDDLLEQVDGAVWVGTPSFTPMWRDLTQARHRGSPEVAPVYDDARHVRFVTRPADLQRDLYGRRLGAWARPRVVFLQYPSDPIVWWSPDLAHREPDWIGESAGSDVNPNLRWWPLVTFWQLSLDMAMAGETPAGHGHIYEDDMVPVWAAVLRGSAASAELQESVAAAIRADVTALGGDSEGG